MSKVETKMAEATLKENDKAFDAFSFLARFAPLIFLLLLMTIFAIMEPRFLSSINLFNVMRQVSITGLLAIGMTFVILTAGIDLSVGSLLAFAGLVAAAVAKGGMQDRFTVGDAAIGYGWPLAALSAILVGLACGYLQGLAITKLKVPAFVVTLGGMSVFRGAALLFAAGGPISGFQPEFTWWGQGRILTVPVPVIIFLLSACWPTSFCITRAMAEGFMRWAEIPKPRALRASMSTGSSAASTSSWASLPVSEPFVLAARLNSAEAVAGTGYELTVIASVVIGGTSLFGGSGSIFGTVIGALLIGVLLNGLVLMNVSSYIQQIIIGVIIVLAVAFDTFAKSRRRKA